MSRSDKGFSLLELLIVVAIILIIATIAIPSLLRSRQAANESSAVANLRTINTAEITYASASGGLFGTKDQLVQEGLIDSRFNSGAAVSGYNYFIPVETGGVNYTAYAFPASPNMGRWGYYSTPDAVVRYATPFPTGKATGDPVN